MRYDHYESGALYGIRYEMRQGESLNLHAHTGDTADQAHNVIVLSGKVMVRPGPGVRFMGYPLKAGHVFDFDSSQLHDIVALEDAVILNLMLHGKPVSFADYTEAQKHGEA